ncbi:MAG: tetratricopeptide repeat protein [Ignavibacteria bacterium]|nr:tetratricopeptide repeat protein [Ignavibacteria bacterium]
MSITKGKFTGIHIIFIAIAAFAVYANSLRNGFVFDDESVVLGDKSITSVSNIPKFFTGELGFHKVIGRYYRPIVSASYAVDYALWGFNPFGFHLTNVLIHTVCSVLFYLLLVLMFRGYASSVKNYIILASGLVFALHPIHTEAVAWISGRTDSICGLFYFLSFIFYLKFKQDRRKLFAVLLCFSYLLAMLAKEMAVTLPVAIILYDIIVERRKFKENYALYILLALVTVFYVVIRWYALKDTPDRLTYHYFFGKDAPTVFFTMIQTIPLYFRLSIIPYSMVYHYGGYLPYQYSIMNFNVLFGIFFTLLIIISSVYLIRRAPVISYSLIFFILTLLPVMNIVSTLNFMADRFLYIPSAFVSFIIASVGFKYYSKSSRNILLLSAAALLTVYSVMTVSRNNDWKDNETLFLSAEGKPGSVLYVNIGNIFGNRGQYNEAEVYYRKAIDLKNESLLANLNLGKIFMIRGNFDSAYHYMYKAYLLDTLSPDPPYSIAQLYAAFNDPNSSIEWLEKVRKLVPGYMDSDKTLEEMRRRINMPQSQLPQDTKHRVSLLESSSFMHYQKKEYHKAISELEELLRLNPAGAAGYYNNIGMCYLEQSDLKRAIDNFNKAIESNSSFVIAYNNLGTCYEKQGDLENAVRFFRKAVELDSTNQNALENLRRIEMKR